MSVEVRTSTIEAVTVVTVTLDQDDDSVLELVADGIAAIGSANPLIVDLSHAASPDGSGLRALLERLARLPGLLVVCAGLAGRRCIRELGGGSVAVFPSVETALTFGRVAA
jgi:hypothetical protein